jgi:hypothetical protein
VGLGALPHGRRPPTATLVPRRRRWRRVVDPQAGLGDNAIVIVII